MYINLEDAAKLLKVNCTTLSRWVQKGMLTSHKIDGSTSFDRDELVRFIKKTSFNQMEHEPIGEKATDREIDDRLILTKAINRGIFTKLTGSLMRDELFNKVVDLLGYVNEINFPRDLLVSKLIEREEEISTALTKGIALPHPKNTPELHFEKSIICVVTLENPVVLNKSCNEPIDLLFFLFSKNPMEHLKLLSTIAKLISSNSDLKEIITSTESRKDLVDIIQNLEQKLLGI